MVSLIHVGAEDNALDKGTLLFSSPNITRRRNHITVKASLDDGLTRLSEHQLVLDEGEGQRHNYLTMIDRETIGILCESSVAHMASQAVKLKDLVR